MDSSAYVKLPLREPEEEELRAEMAEWGGYVSSALLGLEAIRACARHSEAHARDARDWLIDVSLLPIDERLLHLATSLQPAGLRSLDAIHLATAISVRDDIGAFFTYDDRLAAGAKNHGLNVLAPA